MSATSSRARVTAGNDHDHRHGRVEHGLGHRHRSGVRVSPRLFVEEAYRYSDFGEVVTPDGTIEVVRGTRVLVIDNGAGTRASLTSHGLFLGMRLGFGL